MIELGEYIKQKRLAKNISQRELAKLVGVSHTTISRIEKGEINNFSIGILLALNEVIGIDIHYIIDNVIQNTAEGKKLIKKEEDETLLLLEKIERLLRKYEEIIQSEKIEQDILNQIEMLLYWEKIKKEKRGINE